MLCLLEQKLHSLHVLSDMTRGDDHQNQALIFIGQIYRVSSTAAVVVQELYRVLKPGSKVAVLDFNNTDDPLVDQFQAFSLENIVVPAARLYGLAEEYEYLRPSIKRFATGSHCQVLHCTCCCHKL